MPSTNGVVEQGPVPGRPDMRYRWAHDETKVSFDVLIDGEWRTLTQGFHGVDDLFRDHEGNVIARMVGGANRPTLVTTLDALDHAAAELRRKDGDPLAASAVDDRQPRLCPAPTPEPITTKSENSLRYQEYVSGLPRGWAIRVSGVNFDVCDEKSGRLLEAKANIDHLFNENDELQSFVYAENDPALQMEKQADIALLAGRKVIWHAQTPKGFQGLLRISNMVEKPNLSVVYDPN